MTWKDKLEIGLEKDAPFRRDNLPDDQVRGEEVPAGEGRSPVVPAAREDGDATAGIPPNSSRRRKRRSR
jgi:hypothetical protein